MFRFIAPLALLLALVVQDASANSTMRICNNDDKRLIYAVVEEVGFGPFFAEWEARGWFEVLPGRCRLHWNRPGSYQKGYLSVLTQEEQGVVSSIRDHGVDRIPSRLPWSAAIYGTEAFFCVSEGPFRRRQKQQSDHESCSGDDFLQLFNMYYWVPENSNFRLGLD